ncbi:MAG: DUF882 domain-containing protein [Parvibaculaceae bacterium]
MTSRLKKYGLCLAAASFALCSSVMLVKQDAHARGETRTLSLYHVHTKETLTTTYMRDGRYVPSEMAKIDRLMRDWRKNAVIKMDPETIDLMWELHEDLGSKAPIYIICGYRSGGTNAMLKKIGRNVARQSQHIRGKAIDLYFPDVSSERVRNSALVRQIGGVGFYPRSGPKGFVHIDSGTVRHWPGISDAKMASIFRDYRKTVGARAYRRGQEPVMVAEAEAETSPKQAAPVPATKPQVPVVLAKAEVKAGPPMPRPRPIEVLMLAAAQLQIEPAAAPVPKVNFAERPSPVTDDLGTVVAAETLIEVQTQHTNTAAKSSFADMLRFGEAKGTPLIKPLTASVTETAEDLLKWPVKLLTSAERLIRRDGAPQPFGTGIGPVPVEHTPELVAEVQKANLQTALVEPVVAAPLPIAVASPVPLVVDPIGEVFKPGKGDLLTVNRSLKGDLVLKRRRVGSIQRVDDPTRNGLSRTFENLLEAQN